MEQSQSKQNNSFRKMAHKSRVAYEAKKTLERRRKKKADAETYITGTYIFVDNGARVVKEVQKEMNDRGITFGKEAAIQHILNQEWQRRHGKAA